MMPINLRVLIHQKQVTKLLAECGNSNMPIVVRAVRFRPGEGEVISARARDTGARHVGRHAGPGRRDHAAAWNPSAFPPAGGPARRAGPPNRPARLTSPSRSAASSTSTTRPI